MKDKTFNKNIPSEVWEVGIIQYSKIPVGSFIANKCKETINKYPEYFKNMNKEKIENKLEENNKKYEKLLNTYCMGKL